MSPRSAARSRILRQDGPRDLTAPLRGALGLAAFLCACSTAPDDAAGPAAVVTSVAFDGLVVLEEVGPRERILSLFDPNTGRSSAGQVVTHRALAPDGRHVAFFGASGPLTVARPSLVDGAPELTVVHTLDVGQSPIRWVDDTALVTDSSRVDVVTGEVRTCQEPTTQTERPIVPVPGSDDHLCVVDGSTLHRYVDGELAGTLRGSGALSPDGQFLGHALHLPTGVLVEGLSDAFPLANTFDRFPNATGRELLLPRGGHGELVEVGFSGLETVFKRIFVDDMPADGRALDYAAIHAAGVIDHDSSRWDVEKALRPWFNQGTGRYYAPLLVRPDGSAAIYSVISHVVETRFVGEDVGQEPSLVEVFVASALVEVFPDGSTRGFLTSDTAHDAVALGDDGLDDLGRRYGASSRNVDLDADDWLVPGFRRDSLGVLQPAMWGMRDGRPTVIDGHASKSQSVRPIVSPDGRWLIGVGDPAIVGDPQPICLRDLTGGPARCVAPTRAGFPIGVAGQGLHAAFADAPPLLLGLSRVAAPLDAVVDVYGAHFGAAGTLTIDDAAVAATDILDWADNRVRLRLSASLPALGSVRVETAAGTSSGRDFQLGRSPTASPPFSGVPRGPFPLAQGVNLVDLGDLGATEPFIGNPSADTVRVIPESRQPDGRFALLSVGGRDEHHTVTVTSGGFSRVLDFILTDRLVDDSRWQLVVPHILLEDRYPGFVTLAGDLIERSDGVHPTLGARFALASLPNRNPVGGATGKEIPEYFRTDGDATYVSLGYQDVQLSYPGWPLRQVVSYTAADGTWGAAQYAASPQLALPNYHRHFAVDGDTLLVVGADPLGEGGPHYALSHDGGATLGPGTLTPEGVLPVTSALAEPITVRAAGGTFFLVFEIPLDSVEVLGVHAITPTGDFEADVIAAPPGVSLSGYGRAFFTPLLQATDGGRVLVHFGSARTMLIADFDDDEPAWTVLPSAADAGAIRSFFHDPDSGDVIAIRLDGTLALATRAGAWRDWAPLDLGFDLSVAVTLVPTAVAKLPDGRWVVHANWNAPDAAPGTPSVFGRAGWLVGPR